MKISIEIINSISYLTVMTDSQNDKNEMPQSFQEEINIPEEELQRVIAAMMKTLEMGICVVYGEKDAETDENLQGKKYMK